MNSCCGEGILWFLHENSSLCRSKSQAAAWILCLTPFHMDSSSTLSASVAAFSVFTSLFSPSPQPTINSPFSLGEEALPSPALTPDCPWVALTPTRCVWFGCLQVLGDLDYKTLPTVSSDPELSTGFLCWLFEHLSADNETSPSFLFQNPPLSWACQGGHGCLAGHFSWVQLVFKHLPRSAALNTPHVALSLFSCSKHQVKIQSYTNSINKLPASILSLMSSTPCLGT